MNLSIREKMHFGLIGYPLGHSISPFIHTELQKCTGVVADYSLIEFENGTLEANYNSRLKTLNGFNVTIPYKTEIIKHLDKLSPRAELFGAVNTVDIKNGVSVGYNTDTIGFARALGCADIELGGKVLILGCGGASRMFAYESAIAGANITLGIRESSVKKAEILKNEMLEKLNYTLNISDINNINDNYDLIINGTPVGMYPSCDASPVREETVARASAVFDAVYNPFETRLIQYAKKHGKKCVNGLPMLVWQAAVAEEIWNDVEFEQSDIDLVMKLAKELLTNE